MSSIKQRFTITINFEINPKLQYLQNITSHGGASAEILRLVDLGVRYDKLLRQTEGSASHRVPSTAAQPAPRRAAPAETTKKEPKKNKSALDPSETIPQDSPQVETKPTVERPEASASAEKAPPALAKPEATPTPNHAPAPVAAPPPAPAAPAAPKEQAVKRSSVLNQFVR